MTAPKDVRDLGKKRKTKQTTLTSDKERKRLLKRLRSSPVRTHQ